MPSLPLALGIAFLASVAAYRAHALTADGTLAAAVCGSLVLVGGGWHWAAIMVVFFVSANLLSRALPAPSDRIAAKTDRRDAAQVLANGGVAAALALAALLTGPTPWMAGFSGSLAAATADTWATEIGRTGRRPRLITTLRAVPVGTSGGVTVRGVTAATAGAALIAFASAVLAHDSALLLPVAVAGLLGSLADSLLGATVQEVRLCPICGQQTEQGVHRSCGARTFVVRGWPGINNDAVNAMTTLCGAIVALSLARLPL
jgi:uncharacterized protein (TIGR00297 family)